MSAHATLPIERRSAVSGELVAVFQRRGEVADWLELDAVRAWAKPPPRFTQVRGKRILGSWPGIHREFIAYH
jgi:hypothetical protein